ncbi:gluconeogenesis factor YvcK family protein [Propionispira raffinosivorans]|uniref:gluconeogenesis factor YvcK family protein n=1 Tax=Propionispira raffinosivorans TaxID=86959 RepID=UPI000360D179|nr:gluconeogenesis factor YvcK family protein [Propionispira raffinosivorans]
MHLLKWLYPGMRFKRWLFLFAVGVMMVSLGLAVVFNYKYIDNIEELIFRTVYMWTGTYYYMVTAVVGSVVILVGSIIMLLATRMIIRSVITVLLPDSSDKLVDLIYEKRKLNRGPAVTVIGGGTGLSVLLRGIKEATSNVTAVVTVADDGGSSGRLREELGIIPPGDLRNCLVALADTEPLMEKLFQHRFGGTSELAGHSFGNLFIAAMTEVTGDVETALKESSKVLAVKGRVLPASTEIVRLNATMTDGSVVEGESQIPLVHKRIHRVHLSPEHVKPVASSIEAIKKADAIILGPGSLYTSIMPNLLVDDVAKTLRDSKAVKIYICNVMTQSGETDGYTASMHAKAILDHAGPGSIDYVLVNSGAISPELQEFYAKQNSFPVLVDEDELNALGVGFVKADIISETNVIHHDPVKLSRNVMKMVYGLKANPENMRMLDYYMTGNKLK